MFFVFLWVIFPFTRFKIVKIILQPRILFKTKKPVHRRANSLRLTRFERATPTSAGWCSNPTELQSHTKKYLILLNVEKRGLTEATGVEPARPFRNRRISNPLYYRSTTPPVESEREGFEPPDPWRSTVFKTAPVRPLWYRSNRWVLLYKFL